MTYTNVTGTSSHTRILALPPKGFLETAGRLVRPVVAAGTEKVMPFITALIFLLLVTAPAHAQSSASPQGRVVDESEEAFAGATRRVVVLYDERVDLPGLAILDAALVQSLTSELAGSVEVYREAMDLSRLASAGTCVCCPTTSARSTPRKRSMWSSR